MWRDTWYDSTLPFWFLDRTFLNTSILATSTCYRFANGRFYGWEGVGCCEGTCGHVYHYAHATARLFPELERSTRERIDFGSALQPDGAIHFRGEFNDIPAVDAQAGTVLRALREHQMSADAAFLKRNWPKIKLATQWLIAKDANGDGLIEGNQHNTLDTDWYRTGRVVERAVSGGPERRRRKWPMKPATRSSRGSAAAFLRRAKRTWSRNFSTASILLTRLTQNIWTPSIPAPVARLTRCSGKAGPFKSACRASCRARKLCPRCNRFGATIFRPMSGRIARPTKRGRWYAMAGEAGLLMCSFPRRDWDYAQARGKGPEWAAGYFNECMNGFEYQAAGHMIWEGLTLRRPGRGARRA